MKIFPLVYAIALISTLCSADQTAEKCNNSGECKNGRECRNNVCECKPGLKGDNCELIEYYVAEFQNDEDDNGMWCYYDTNTKQTTCQCENGKEFNGDIRICQVPCKAYGECLNGGECQKGFCRCKDGTKGDRCEIVIGCTEELKIKCIKAEADCESFVGGWTTCSCRNFSLIYNGEKCVERCYDHSYCKNGGQCMAGYCNCREGTKGDRCEILTRCTDEMNRACVKANAKCVFDKASSKASCVCNDQAKVYNGKTCVGSIKPRCNYDYECHYGGKCIGNVCHCRKGMSGGKCEEINECQTLKEVCEKGNAVCSYDIEEEKAFCECEEGKSYDGMTGKCKDCRCTKNAKCTFDGNGEPFCRCIKGFKDFEGQCRECDCGPHGMCSFRWDGTKQCSCHDGYVDWEKKCKECVCGPHERCYFDVNGEQKCGCVEGFSVFKGKCLECSCGSNGTCYFDEDGKKQCKCDERYVEYEGQCICGEGYVEYEGQCRERCYDDSYCKNGGKCTDGFCKCREGTKGDRCEILTRCTEEMNKDCAKANAKCVFDKPSGKASCVCKDQAKIYNGKICIEKCQKSSDCHNGGTCIDNVCLCKNGTSGSRCEIIEECERRGHICEEANATCLYDIEEEEVYCKCKEEGKTYDIVTERCREFCIDNSHCANGGKCSRGFCRCKAGTEGDKCTIVTGCTDDFVSKCTAADATCVFDETAENKASCKCRSAKLSFNGERCAESCKDDSDCQNKGECVNGFCKCKDGTEGDKCEIVTGCTDEFRKKCNGIDAVCTFDETSVDKATCVCKDSSLLYNGEKCVERCEKRTDCKNQGECVNGFCKCKDGTEGDKCEIVTGCTDELRKKCNGIDAVCTFDETSVDKATCVCRDSSLLYNGEKCVEPCSDSSDCHNGGECVNKFCKCRDGTAGDKCTVVTGCTDELAAKCSAVDAMCVYDDRAENKASCVCKNPKLFYNGERCAERCEKRTDCQNQGECINGFCKCKDGTYGDKCEIVTGCTDELKKKCTNADADCIFDETSVNKATCVCRNNLLRYNGETCVETCTDRGDCENEAECVNGFCKCKDGTKGDKCEIVTGCTDELKRKCAKADAVCTYDETSVNKVTCRCRNDLLRFDGEKCIEPCRDRTDCKNDGECRNGFCKCKDGTEGDKCEIVTGCTDELKKKCARAGAICTFDETAANKATCTCRNDLQRFNGKKCVEPCRDDSDCSNGGECVHSFCKCRDGTEGDKCTIVTGCTEDMVSKCTAADATCVYDETAVNKASCVCRNPELSFNGQKCAERCREDVDCENNGQCKNDFCKCRDGTEGDKCEIVTGCTDELKRKCTFADAECKYDETSEEKAICVCRKKSMRFNGEKCIDLIKPRCKNDNNCHNGGKCVGNVCHCRRGTSGGRCEDIDDCQTLREVCEKGNAVCSYDIEEEKAFCECEEGKSFDSLTGKCRDCRCGISAKCFFDRNGEPFCRCIKGFKNFEGECKECDCGPQGMCVFGWDGVKQCSCNEGYMDWEKRCKECNCGPHGMCYFGFEGEKKCSCDEGYSVFEGKCLECSCGSNGTCYFDEDGQKQCKCDQRYVEYQGQCEECNCGQSGTCYFDAYKQKKCDCYSRFKEFDGECLECYCGAYGTCTFGSNGEQLCTCNEGFKEFDGRCKECDCGLDGTCSFGLDGEKHCNCNTGFRDYEGVCRECDCGPNGACFFDLEGRRQCKCNDGFKEYLGKCKECDCGLGATCYFNQYGGKYCLCNVGYEEFNEKCIECNCGPYSNCSLDTRGKKQCFCSEGYRELNGKCKECSCGENGACSFDRSGYKLCMCDKGFKEHSGICRECYCGSNSSCVLNKFGNKECICQDDYVEFKGLCKECICGQNSICAFDKYGRKRCACKTGFAKFEGECYECNCGKNSACSFGYYGDKQCDCGEGFVAFDGKCRECVCGGNSTCIFDKYGNKNCICEDHFAEFEGYCRECSCGPNSKCKFDKYGNQQCTCKEGFAKFNGACKECNCGNKSNCTFSYYGVKKCICADGYVEYEGKCRECYCGPNSKCVIDGTKGKKCLCGYGFSEFGGLCRECNCGQNSTCSLDRYGQKTCTCKDGFVQILGMCRDACENYPCKNGKCVRISGKGATCQCESNYKGTFCDIPVEPNFEIKKETLVFIVTVFGGILITILLILFLIACLLCRRSRSGHTEIHESHWNYKIHRCPN